MKALEGTTMDKNYRICVINPGSTSTKVTIFKNEKPFFSSTARLDGMKVQAYANISNALSYYREIILATLDRQGINLEETDAFIGMAAGIQNCEDGVYEVNDLMTHHLSSDQPQNHPILLAPQLAKNLGDIYKAKAFGYYLRPGGEMQPIARASGLSSVVREGRDHPINQKEIGRRYAVSIGKRYDALNLVIAHIGGGVSISTHKKGRIIDSSDCILGDGPMSPTRTGAVPLVPVIQMCYSGKYTKEDMLAFMTNSGGFMNHLGTADMREIMARIKNGDAQAEFILEVFAYQVSKCIGSYAVVTNGEVDAILITGGVAHNNYVVERITEMVKFIAPVKVYPGEFEMEAMALAALRVLKNEQAARTYTGASS